MNRTAKLAELSDEELRHEEKALEETIFRLRFQLKTGNVENPAKLTRTRRDLARVKTLLRERELGLQRTRAPRAAAAPATSSGDEA
jgi:large subunit ribosomal protein L29